MTGLTEQLPALVFVAGARACAIPLRFVRETMRPLPVDPIAGVPAFVRGLSVIRGVAVPVVDVQALLEGAHGDEPIARYVTIKAGERVVALGVESVPGVVFLDPSRLAALPPLVDSLHANFVEAIATHDSQLLIVIQAARLVPAEVWATIERRGPVS